MSQFTHIADWDARGIAVHDALTSAADTAQADVRAELDAAGVTYQTYWITNAILVEEAGETVVNDLACAPGVEGIYASFDYEHNVASARAGCPAGRAGAHLQRRRVGCAHHQRRRRLGPGSHR